MKREFHCVGFNHVNEINEKLNEVSQYLEFLNKRNETNTQETNEEDQVKNYLNAKYNVTGDMNHRMKASELYDIIVNSKRVSLKEDKVAGFRMRLSNYLKNLGLRKKRYNDGYYYYGILPKYPTMQKRIEASVSSEQMFQLMQQVCIERDNELNEIISNLKGTMNARKLKWDSIKMNWVPMGK